MPFPVLGAVLLSFTVLGVPSVPGLPAQDPQDSRGVQVFDGGAAEASLGYAQRHALVIGIDEYHDPAFPDLDHAVRDAEGVAQVLIEKLGFRKENVRLLRNESASKAGLEASLDDWACDKKRMGEEDLMVVFFAGHGVTRDLGRRGKRGYLVPPDGRRQEDGEPVWSTLYSMDDLEGVSEAIPAKHALFILDCCFGGLVQRRSTLPVAPGLQSRARQILTAGSQEQTVLDGGGGGHSVFTAELIAALKGNADATGDGVVSFAELYEYVERRVVMRTESRQTPQQDYFPDHDGGMIALFPPGVKPGGQSVAERLEAMERSDAEKAAEIRLLSDALAVRDLEAELDRLWPRRPSMVKAMRGWLQRAQEVIARRLLHEAALLRVRDEVYLEQVLSGLLAEGSSAEPVWEKADQEQRFRLDTFQYLVVRQKELSREVVEVESRQELAESIVRQTVEEHADAWDEAINEIALGDLYDGLELTPQVGLVPIGPDPDSELWEFCVWETGERPQRDDEEKLIVTGETGIVLVLVPGGTFWMGAQKDDPDARNYDPEREGNELLHEVTLDAYFISKYELTQGQWERIMGPDSNPSYFGASNNLTRDSWKRHPVEQVSWEDCHRALHRVGLVLPTEARWERAARAETDTPWWCGPRESLEWAANLADQAHARLFPGPILREDWDDGFPAHAPVGTFPGNGFGLHDVHGNVWEWCSDRPVFYKNGHRAGDGALLGQRTHDRVYRGGCYRRSSVVARSADRMWDPATSRTRAQGCRPAMGITPE